MASQTAQILTNFGSQIASQSGSGLRDASKSLMQGVAAKQDREDKQLDRDIKKAELDKIKQQAFIDKFAPIVHSSNTPEKWAKNQQAGFLPPDMKYDDRNNFLFKYYGDKALNTVEVASKDGQGTEFVEPWNAVGRKGKAEGGVKSFDQEKKLRNEFDKASDDYIKVRDAHTRVLEAAKDPSPAGDLAMIFNYMKVLDPGSTVREGEFATAQNAMATIGKMEDEGSVVPNFVKRSVQQLMEGTRLLPEQRDDFLNRSGRLYKGQLANQEALEERYITLSDRYDLDPQNVVFRYRLPDGSGVEKPMGDISDEDLRNMSIEDLQKLKSRL